MNLPKIILGYLLMGWGIFGMVGPLSLSRGDWGNRKTIDWGWAFAGLSYLAAVLCFMGGYFLALIPAFQYFEKSTEGFWLNLSHAFREENGVVLFLSLAALYHLGWLLTLGKRYQIARGYAVSLEGRTLYPRDEIHLYPWFSYTPQVLPEDFDLYLKQDLSLGGKHYLLHALVSVKVGIREAQARRASLGDVQSFARKCQAWASQALFGQLKDFSFKDLAQGVPNLAPQATEIEGFQIFWNGSVKIELAEA